MAAKGDDGMVRSSNPFFSIVFSILCYPLFKNHLFIMQVGNALSEFVFNVFYASTIE